MSKQRIRLTGDHNELNIEGMSYQPDDTGAFIVPVEHAKELIRVHGGNFEDGPEIQEAKLDALKADLAATKTRVEILERAVKAATENLAKYKAHIAKLAEDKLDVATTPKTTLKIGK